MINIVCIKRNEFIHSVNAVKLGILLNVATLFYQLQETLASQKIRDVSCRNSHHYERQDMLRLNDKHQM